VADSSPGGVADTTRMVGHLRDQAEDCGHLGSPLYRSLLSRVADDVEAGGPALDVLRGHENDPGPSALALRLMGGVHRLVLERRAPALALTFPSVEGTGDAEAAWPALRDVLVEHRDELRAGLGQAPQTNEVGRSAALVGGLLHVAASASDRRPLRLVEIGASAGLNLRADRYRIELPDGRSTGPSSSPVVLGNPWRGVVPPLTAELDVVERLGCDVAPLDPTTTEGRLRLTSYVWADQLHRLERLRGALAVAAEVPATLEAAGAADFLERLPLREGTTTVLWHSLMWQYLGADEQARVQAAIDLLGVQASATAGFAHLAMEPRRRTPGAEHELLVTLRTWPGGDSRVLGTSTGHGIPTTWEN
jgi:hypothetical protein